MGRSTSSLRYVLFLSAVLALCVARLAAADDDDDAIAQEMADRAEEEAAAAAVEAAAEDEEDDDAGASDGDADASRFDHTDPSVFPLTDMAEPAKDAEFGYAFDKGLSDGVTLTLGQKVRAVIGVFNGGRSKLHVWGVMGSLNMPHDFGQYVQNFTYGVVNSTVGAGGEMSFEFAFTPNERLDTREFVMALSVFYEAQGASGNVIRAHATTFLNQTVTAVAGPQAVGNTLFMFLLLGAIAAATGAGYYAKSLSDEKKTPTASSEPSDKSKAGGNDNWLEGHNTMLQKGSRKKTGKVGRSK